MPAIENYVESESARIWSCSSGTGLRDVLIFNGGPGCNDYLAPVAAMLEPQCRVVRFESRGCGRSTRDGNYDLATTLADARAVCAHYGMEEPLLLGHSQGVNHALAYALEYSGQTSGIIGLAGGKVVDDRHWSEEFHRRQAVVGEDLGGLVFDADPAVNRIGNLTYREYCRQPMLLRRLADLAIPVSFINAANDIRPNWPTQQLAALLPNSRYTEIAEAEHMLWLKHAAEVERELLAALDWIEAGGRA